MSSAYLLIIFPSAALSICESVDGFIPTCLLRSVREVLRGNSKYPREMAFDSISFWRKVSASGGLAVEIPLTLAFKPPASSLESSPFSCPESLSSTFPPSSASFLLFAQFTQNPPLPRAALHTAGLSRTATHRLLVGPFDSPA